MKRLHRKDLYCWSEFNETLDIDFNSFLWTGVPGNVAIDPLPMRAHDVEHLRKLGGARFVLLTNSDHLRGTKQLLAGFSAQVIGPEAEKDRFPIPCARWAREGEEVFPGLRALALDGSKTPGELALLLAPDTLICGDLLRSHRAESLMLLRPDQGLKDASAAGASVRRLAALPGIDTILMADGWCLFGDGSRRLAEFASSLPG